jgi:hypothetical protein
MTSDIFTIEIMIPYKWHLYQIIQMDHSRAERCEKRPAGTSMEAGRAFLKRRAKRKMEALEGKD